jgi:hypothetical protein
MERRSSGAQELQEFRSSGVQERNPEVRIRNSGIFADKLRRHFTTEARSARRKEKNEMGLVMGWPSHKVNSERRTRQNAGVAGVQELQERNTGYRSQYTESKSGLLLNTGH